MFNLLSTVLYINIALDVIIHIMNRCSIILQSLCIKDVNCVYGLSFDVVRDTNLSDLWTRSTR